jgi:hypothetical protein
VVNAVSQPSSNIMSANQQARRLEPLVPFDGNIEALRTMTYDELQRRLELLDPQMEAEIEELRQRYAAKRQPILDAIDVKKRKQMLLAAAAVKSQQTANHQ